MRADDRRACGEAADVLNSGGVIIYPTETLYGIGALATSESAVEGVFRSKESGGKPIPVLVRDFDMMGEYALLPPAAERLAREFLPGPLTLVLRGRGRGRGGLAGLVSAGTGNVAVRISANEFVKRLFEVVDSPITSTSANVSGGANIYSITELIELFSARVDLIVDSGNIPISKGSTVIDMTSASPLLLREGDIPFSDIKEFLSW